MSTLAYAQTVADALKGAECVHFLAPQSRLREGWLAEVAPPSMLRLLDRAAREEDAGTSGKTVLAQHPDGGPTKIALTIVPDSNTRSRHNAPACPEEAFAGFQAGGLGSAAGAAAIFCAEEEAYVMPLLRAAGRALPSFSLATGKKKTAKRKLAVVATDGDGVVRTIGKLDRAAVEHARMAAEWVDMPPSHLNVREFASRVRALARNTPGLTCQVLAGAQVLAAGMRGLHAVGRTAIHPPHVLLLSWKPPKAKRTVALVGKGVIYDTGGLSIKVGGGMVGMKADMGGAAAVIGATVALARSQHPERILCVAGLVENAIGPNAYRPDDILVMHSGKTVEVNNTDAEGRLVLADAASWILRKHKPDAIVDLATLTGAQLVATGQRHAAVVSNRAGLERAAVDAGRASGDLTHPLPFAPEFYQSQFTSQVADMRNSVADRMDAQSSCAAQFVYSHIADLDVPWLHVDMAGPAFRKDRATGYGVALLTRLLTDLDSSDLTA